MSFRAVLASVLAPVIGVSALTGGEWARPGQTDDRRNADLFQEEKVEQPLGDFRGRVQKMLDVQTSVREKTLALDKLRGRAAAKAARRRDRPVSLKLAAEEKKLVVEATIVLDVLESEGPAIAFRQFVEQLREDMRRVQRLLERGHLGTDIQAIEDDILDSLKEIVASLRRG
jgi:hypothetical protein